MWIERSYFQQYAAALLAVLLAVAARAVLDPLLGENLPYYLFYFAVIGASLWGGIGPGFVALAGGFVLGTYFFAMPRFSLAMDSREDLLGAFRFISLGTVMVLATGWVRAARTKWMLEMSERRAREIEARTQQEVSQRTLASIGDGLIRVDAQGRVTFMNEVAEELCGWKAGEAMGMGLSDVFPIVHRKSGLPIPDPATRAMQDGAVVNLPPDTVLIDRSGGTRAIDDSAAPIRDAGGRIIGSVIVFRQVLDAPPKAVPDARAFRLLGVQLYPAHDSQTQASVAELEQLERACRAWIEQEWTMNTNMVRLVSLNEFDLIVRQDSVEWLANGEPGIRFRAAYER